MDEAGRWDEDRQSARSIRPRLGNTRQTILLESLSFSVCLVALAHVSGEVFSGLLLCIALACFVQLFVHISVCFYFSFL